VAWVATSIRAFMEMVHWFLSKVFCQQWKSKQYKA